MLAKAVALFLLAFMLQTEALPNKNQDSSSVDKLISGELDVFSPVKLITFFSEQSDILVELVPSVASTIYKVATCKTETKSMVLPHIADVMACINITINIYDIEIFLYHTFQFSEVVINNTVNFVSEVLECHSASSNVFDIVLCALNTVDASVTEFKVLVKRTSDLVLELEGDYFGLTDNVKKCEGLATISLLRVWSAINSEC